MKILKIILLTFLFSYLNVPVFSQENMNVPVRTPEQEATKQTEKLQQELNLNSEQVNRVYEINLKYARERQVSNSRSAALERVKNKETDLQRVLNQEQYNRLQNKRYERSSFQSPTINRDIPLNSSGLRSSTNQQTTQQPARRQSTSENNRSNYSTTAPKTVTREQTSRGSNIINQQGSTSRQQTIIPERNPSSSRTSGEAPTSYPTRSSTPTRENSSPATSRPGTSGSSSNPSSSSRR